MRTRGTPRLTWHACICLALVALLLYNPFAGLWGSPDRVSCDKLARNRATVGASELQHFSPVSRLSTQIELDADVPVTLLLEPVLAKRRSAERPEAAAPYSESFLDFRNRPPPTL